VTDRSTLGWTDGNLLPMLSFHFKIALVFSPCLLFFLLFLFLSCYFYFVSYFFVFYVFHSLFYFLLSYAIYAIFFKFDFCLYTYYSNKISPFTIMSSLSYSLCLISFIHKLLLVFRVDRW